MFTGLVEELGTVRAVIPNATGARLEIEATTVLDDVTLGASIAVNGCCLTAVEFDAGWWAADAVEETLRRTCLGGLAAGDRVNLERPVRLADRLGGHIVQGHVDGVGEIVSREPGDRWDVVTIGLPADLARYVVEKGSITVDGISLTVVEARDDAFTVALIPTTLELTTLGRKRPGDPVNLEVDVVAKYVERLVAAGSRP
jgi:riboflavin synthase